MEEAFDYGWRVKMELRFAAAVSALMWSSVAAASPPTPLQPVDKWDLNYGETQCIAARSYGDAASPTVLGIVPSLKGTYYKVMVSVPRDGPAYAKESRGTVDFGRGAISSELLYYGKSGVKQSVYQFSLSAAEMAQAEAATAVTVKADDGSYSFSLSSMPQLMSALRTCSTNLRQHWNVGATTAPDPIADIHSLLKRKDFPTEAQRMKPRSSLQYELMIDEKGEVAGCEIVAPSGAQVLDETGCQIIAGSAKFRPASDASGKPVRSAWVTPPLVWKKGDGNALDSSCQKLSSDGRTVVNLCGRMDQNRLQPISREQEHVVAAIRDRSSDKRLILAGAVHVGGVEEGGPAIDRMADHPADYPLNRDGPSASRPPFVRAS
jgi:hypothetical protein